MATTQDPGDPVLVRTYVGTDLKDVVAAYYRDARELAADGYEPVSQVYVHGEWNFVEVVVSVVACLILIGFPLVIRLLATRPVGSLVVTYMARR